MNFLVDVDLSIHSKVHEWCQTRFGKEYWRYSGAYVEYNTKGERTHEYARFWFHRYDDAIECKMVWL